jgi:Tfp pilus assembly protein PilF
MNAKKAPGAAPDRRSAHAVELFEKAMKALGKRDYERAKEQFGTLIASHPDERDLVERAALYRGLCDRALEKRPSFRPKTLEDLVNYGVFLHNRGEYQEALKYFAQAAEQQPKNEHVLYCTAAAAAQAGDTAAALRALKAAIQANAANRAQARSDSDFDSLRDNDEFLELLEPQES